MATGLNIAIDLLETIFIKTTGFGGNFWLIQCTIILATLILLTRKITDWKQLAFPVIIGWHTFGLRMPWIFMVGAGTMFVIDTMSLQTMSNTLNGFKNLIMERSWESGVGVKGKFKSKLSRFKEDKETKLLEFGKKRMDVQEELIKLRKYKGLTPEIRRLEESTIEGQREGKKKYIKEKTYKELLALEELKRKKVFQE